MSKYKVILTEKFSRQLAKIPSNYRAAILRTAYSLGQNPYAGKALSGQLKGYFSYRIGVYRLIYQIAKKNLLVLILAIGHRRDIYRLAP